jgi:N-carbamoylputrescine amidase
VPQTAVRADCLFFVSLTAILQNMINKAMDRIKVGLVQSSFTGDLTENRRRMAAGIDNCADRGAKLVVLPELHNSLYFCQTENTGNFDLAESVPGPSTEYFGAIARNRGIVLVVSLFEKRAAGLYHNTAVVMDSDGRIAGKYRKMHIPDDPAYYEKFYFTPGDLGFVPVQTSAGKLGVMVCWDQWYPEAARLMALAGAEMLVYPTAIGWESSDSEDEKRRQNESWMIAQRAHAVNNGLPVIAVNRVGHEVDPSGLTRGILFWGSSFVAGQQGEVIAQASSEMEECIVAEIDKGRTEDVRRWWPFLRDRRTDFYDGLTKRFID